MRSSSSVRVLRDHSTDGLTIFAHSLGRLTTKWRQISCICDGRGGREGQDACELYIKSHNALNSLSNYVSYVFPLYIDRNGVDYNEPMSIIDDEPQKL